MLHTHSQMLLLDPSLFHVRVRQIFLFIAFLNRLFWAEMECHLSLLNQTKIEQAKNQQSFTSFVYKNANKNIQNQKGRFFRSAAESGCFYIKDQHQQNSAGAHQKIPSLSHTKNGCRSPGYFFVVRRKISIPTWKEPFWQGFNWITATGAYAPQVFVGFVQA